MPSALAHPAGPACATLTRPPSTILAVQPAPPGMSDSASAHSNRVLSYLEKHRTQHSMQNAPSGTERMAQQRRRAQRRHTLDPATMTSGYMSTRLPMRPEWSGSVCETTM